MFYEEWNGFNPCVWPQGYTQWVTQFKFYFCVFTIKLHTFNLKEDGCKEHRFQNLKENAFQMFYEEGNTFNTSPQTHTHTMYGKSKHITITVIT